MRVAALSVHVIGHDEFYEIPISAIRVNVERHPLS